MIFIVAIVAVSMIVPVTRIITTHREKMTQIQSELTMKEIELEKIRQENYIVETENLKLELEKKRLEYSADDFKE